MALDVLANAVYHDVAKQTVKSRVETSTVTDTGAAAINITELPSTSRIAGSSQTGKEQNSTQYNSQNGQKDGIASEQQIKSAISQANSKLRNPHRTRCEFSYHEETKRVSIKVLDNDTQEVIREIPPEETLEMVQKMWELAGLIVDEKR